MSGFESNSESKILTKQKTRPKGVFSFGARKRTRTADLLRVKQAL